MFKLSLLTPHPSLPPPHPPPSVVHQPSHTCSFCPSCYCSLFHTFCPCLSHTDIPVPLTPFINWDKTNGASLIPLNQHKTDNPFLFPCNHVTIHTQTTKIDCNLLLAFVSDSLFFLLFFSSFFYSGGGEHGEWLIQCRSALYFWTVLIQQRKCWWWLQQSEEEKSQGQKDRRRVAGVPQVMSLTLCLLSKSNIYFRDHVHIDDAVWPSVWSTLMCSTLPLHCACKTILGFYARICPNIAIGFAVCLEEFLLGLMLGVQTLSLEFAEKIMFLRFMQNVSKHCHCSLNGRPPIGSVQRFFPQG